MRKLTASSASTPNTVMWNVALNPTETAHSLHRCSMKRAEECAAPSLRRSPNAYQNFNLKLSRLFNFFLPLMYLDLFSSNRLDAEPPMMLLTGDDPQVVFCTQVPVTSASRACSPPPPASVSFSDAPPLRPAPIAPVVSLIIHRDLLNHSCKKLYSVRFIKRLIMNKQIILM